MLAFSLFTRAVTTILNWHLNTVIGCEIGNKEEPLVGAFTGHSRCPFDSSSWQRVRRHGQSYGNELKLFKSFPLYPI